MLLLLLLFLIWNGALWCNTSLNTWLIQWYTQISLWFLILRSITTRIIKEFLICGKGTAWLGSTIWSYIVDCWLIWKASTCVNSTNRLIVFVGTRLFNIELVLKEITHPILSQGIILQGLLLLFLSLLGFIFCWIISTAIMCLILLLLTGSIISNLHLII